MNVLELNNPDKSEAELVRDFVKASNYNIPWGTSRVDSDTGLFLVRDLTKKSTTVLEKEFTEITYNKVLPIIVEPYAGDNLILPEYEKTGGYTTSDRPVDDTKGVGLKIGEQTVGMKYIQNHAQFEMHEMKQGALIGLSVQNEKLMETKRQFEYANEDGAYKGIYDEKNSKIRLVNGLFYYMTSNVNAKYRMTEFTNPADGTGANNAEKRKLENKTNEQVVKLCLEFLRNPVEAEGIKSYQPDIWLLPVGLKTKLQTMAWSDGAGMNMLTYIVNTIKEENPNFQVMAIPELNAVADLGASTTTSTNSAMMCFPKDDRFIAHIINMPYTLSNPIVSAWKTRIETLGRIAGGVVRDGKAVHFCKGII